MPIAVRCSCGKALKAPDKLAGKRVKCPGCQKPLAIPAPPTVSSQQKKGTSSKKKPPTSSRCPECKSILNPGDMICISCGFNIKTGKKLKKTKRGMDVDENSQLSREDLLKFFGVIILILVGIAGMIYFINK